MRMMRSDEGLQGISRLSREALTLDVEAPKSGFQYEDNCSSPLLYVDREAGPEQQQNTELSCREDSEGK